MNADLDCALNCGKHYPKNLYLGHINDCMKVQLQCKICESIFLREDKDKHDCMKVQLQKLKTAIEAARETIKMQERESIRLDQHIEERFNLVEESKANKIDANQTLAHSFISIKPIKESIVLPKCENGHQLFHAMVKK